MRNIVSLKDLSTEEIIFIWEQAEELKRKMKETAGVQRGGVDLNNAVSLRFEAASSRTFGSFLKAARLNRVMDVSETRSDGTSSQSKGEDLYDSALTAASYNTLMVTRSSFGGAARFFERIFTDRKKNCRVINGANGKVDHPTQAILDGFTIREFNRGRLENLVIGIVGDALYGRAVHSLVELLKRFPGIHLKLVSKAKDKMPDWMLDGISHEWSWSLDILGECDFIYWTRFQDNLRKPKSGLITKEQEDEMTVERVRPTFRLTVKFLREKLRKDVKIMHPMPVVLEIDKDVKQDPRVIMYDQLDNGIWTRAILMRMLLASQPEVEELPVWIEPTMTVISSKRIEEAVNAKLSQGRYFRPVQNGTVLDHLPVGMSMVVRRYLNTNGLLPKDRVKLCVEGVESRKLRPGRKDVLVLEDAFLDRKNLAIIRAFAPELTVNMVKDGRSTKLDVTPATLIEGFKDPYDWCISNEAEQAKPNFVPVRHSNCEQGLAKCHWCGWEYTLDELI